MDLDSTRLFWLLPNACRCGSILRFQLCIFWLIDLHNLLRDIFHLWKMTCHWGIILHFVLIFAELSLRRCLLFSAVRFEKMLLSSFLDCLLRSWRSIRCPYLLMKYDCNFWYCWAHAEVVYLDVLVARGEEFALNLDNSSSCVDGFARERRFEGGYEVWKIFEFRLSCGLLDCFIFMFFVFPELFFDEFGFAVALHFNNQ